MDSATGGSSSTAAQLCRRFSLAEIQSATNGFDKKLLIGQGGFGNVYKGHIRSEETSRVVAIKRLDSMSNQGAPEFRAEIEMLSTVRHCHLVSLIGYCDDSKEMILVYEYMPHGTLYYHLHKATTPLNWVQRLKIAIGAGRGLDYLHTGVGTQHGIIHRDVKSSNILLDENWAARISDFGLSKIGPINQPSSYVNVSFKGTFGYMAPESLTGAVTRRTDVYAFGVVLFELLSGRLAVDDRFGKDCSLVMWAQKCVKERKWDQMVDSRIRGTISPKCLRRFAQIADRCLDSCLEKRPTMTEVVVSLKLSLELQERWGNSAESSGILGLTWKMPKYFFFPAKGNSDHNGTTLTKTSGDNMNECGETAAGDLKVFTYGELKHATGDFGDHSRLGMGSYGEVYKGWVDKRTYSRSKQNTGLPIAIKKLHRYKFEMSNKTKLDLKLLREFSHPNLVKLIGYCFKGKEILLVYEFMQNGSLWQYLDNGGLAQLPLVTKVKIAVGIARGLVFLLKTQDAVSGYAPRWAGGVGESLLDRHKILLDEDFTAKLDVVKFIDGHYTRVNVEPDYYYYPGFEPGKRENNLSGFTVVMAELLTGEQIYDRYQFHNLNRMLVKDGIIKPPDSLPSIARLCFETCNDVDAESKMLRVLAKFDEYNPTSEDDMNEPSLTNKDGSHYEMPHEHGETAGGDLKIFTYDELKHAMGHFGGHSRLSMGSYANVYKGWVNQRTYSPSEQNTGLPIAIKGLNRYKFRIIEKSELNLKLLREFSHPNLLKLIGYCIDERLFLVYEFMQNGSLDKYTRNGGLAQLPLATKVKIAVGIARGLVFLLDTQDEVSADAPPWAVGVSESPLERHKILLDEDFTAKLSDYDVVKLVDGYYTAGDNEPDCYDYRGLQPLQLQSSLFGFTVVMAEVLTGKQIYNEKQFHMMNKMLVRDGIIKPPDSLPSIARLCFETCNDVDAESNMLRVLAKFHEYNPT